MFSDTGLSLLFLKLGSAAQQVDLFLQIKTLSEALLNIFGQHLLTSNKVVKLACCRHIFTNLQLTCYCIPNIFSID